MDTVIQIRKTKYLSIQQSIKQSVNNEKLKDPLSINLKLKLQADGFQTTRKFENFKQETWIAKSTKNMSESRQLHLHNECLQTNQSTAQVIKVMHWRACPWPSRRFSTPSSPPSSHKVQARFGGLITLSLLFRVPLSSVRNTLEPGTRLQAGEEFIAPPSSPKSCQTAINIQVDEMILRKKASKHYA